MQGYQPKDGEYAKIEQPRDDRRNMLLWPERRQGEDYSTYWSRRLQGQRLAYRVTHGVPATDGYLDQRGCKRVQKKDPKRKDAIKQLGRRAGIKVTKIVRALDRLDPTEGEVA